MFAIAVLALLACFASTAAAQTTAAPSTFDRNRGNITLTSSFDFVNAYMFRGLRQDDTRLIMWPTADAGIRLHSGTGAVKEAVLHIGSWNSLNTRLLGSQGPSGRLWYESDFYAGLGLALGGGLHIGTTNPPSTRPNTPFTPVKELSSKAPGAESAA